MGEVNYRKFELNSNFITELEKKIREKWDEFVNRTHANAAVCYLWGTPAWKGKLDLKDFYYSPRVGGFYLVDDWICSKNIDEQLKPIEKACLTTWLIEERKSGFVPCINDSTIEEAKRLKPLEASAKASGFLRFLGGRENPYDKIGIFDERIGDRNSGIDALYLYANSEIVNPHDIEAITLNLEQEEYIETIHNPYLAIKLTLAGKMATETITNKDSDEGFIAMWFDDSMNAAHSAIEKAIKMAGYKPVRIDNQEHNKKIDDEIIAAIKRARFIIADFTHGEKGARGGVYYEAGFAHGLGIEVIFSCHKDIVEKIHFDTRQYNHITWQKDKLGVFSEQVANRICATVGDGPDKNKIKNDK